MKVKYTITGLDCPNCAAKLAGMIGEIDGVDEAKINFLTEKLTVEISGDEGIIFSEMEKTAKKFSKSVKIEK